MQCESLSYVSLPCAPKLVKAAQCMFYVIKSMFNGLFLLGKVTRYTLGASIMIVLVYILS